MHFANMILLPYPLRNKVILIILTFLININYRNAFISCVHNTPFLCGMGYGFKQYLYGATINVNT